MGILKMKFVTLATLAYVATTAESKIRVSHNHGNKKEYYPNKNCHMGIKYDLYTDDECKKPMTAVKGDVQAPKFYEPNQNQMDIMNKRCHDYDHSDAQVLFNSEGFGMADSQYKSQKIRCSTERMRTQYYDQLNCQGGA